MMSTCGICGLVVRSDSPVTWHPGQRVRRLQRDMQLHLTTHSFAELLRYEVRKDLDQVPEEQRPTIVRDIYRSLLGQRRDNAYALDDADGLGLYSIDDVLGSLDLYRLWRSANACGWRGCLQHQG
jgi:hypothetical protein